MLFLLVLTGVLIFVQSKYLSPLPATPEQRTQLRADLKLDPGVRYQGL